MGTVESFIIFSATKPDIHEPKSSSRSAAVAEDSPKLAGDNNSANFIIALVLIHFIVDGVEKP